MNDDILFEIGFQNIKNIRLFIKEIKVDDDSNISQKKYNDLLVKSNKYS